MAACTPASSTMKSLFQWRDVPVDGEHANWAVIGKKVTVAVAGPVLAVAMLVEMVVNTVIDQCFNDDPDDFDCADFCIPPMVLAGSILQIFTDKVSDAFNCFGS